MFTLAVQQSFPNSIRVPLKTHSYSLKVNSIGDSSDLGTIACLTLNCTLISFQTIVVYSSERMTGVTMKLKNICTYVHFKTLDLSLFKQISLVLRLTVVLVTF